MNRMSWTAGLAVIGLCLWVSGAFAQGSLTPPGSPAPTMKTLAQVEPRTAITNAPVTISTAGSCYLTTNLSGTVTIAANNVTLDLMGFTIAATSGNAISQTGGRTNVVIRNGVLSAPAGHGIEFSVSSSGANGLIEDVSVNSCLWNGIVAGGGYEIRHCRVQGAGMAGILVYGNSSVRDCTVTGCNTGLRLSGTGAWVEGNRIDGNTDNYDLAAGNQLNLLISEIPETLAWPCMARLAGSLTCSATNISGLTITANDVTIDMAGHTLTGPGANSGHGIYLSGYRNLRVFNGKLVNWLGYPGQEGKRYGIHASGSAGILSDIQSSTNSCGIWAGDGYTLSRCAAYNNTTVGIATGDGCTLSQCVAYKNGGNGINTSYSTVSDCIAHNNGTNGISAGHGSTLSQCAAYNNGSEGIDTGYNCTLSQCSTYDNGSNGIDAGYCNSVTDCSSYHNDSRGINAGYSCSISDCVSYYNTADGIAVIYGCMVSSSLSRYNGNGGDGAGIHVTGNDNRLEGNTVTMNDRGIYVEADGNFIVRNIARGNTTNWVISANNKVGTITNAPNSGAISGNTGGSGVGSTDPWANFTY